MFWGGHEIVPDRVSHSGKNILPEKMHKTSKSFDSKSIFIKWTDTVERTDSRIENEWLRCSSSIYSIPYTHKKKFLFVCLIRDQSPQHDIMIWNGIVIER